MDKVKIDKSKLGYYIVKEEDSKEIRFFLVGQVVDGKFTGMMHDYVGGGNYQEALVINDIFVPSTYSVVGEAGTEALEWDEEISIFEDYTDITVDELNTAMDKFITFDTNCSNYVLSDELLVVGDNGEKSFFCSVGLGETIPYGLGHTSIEEGYQLPTPITVVENDDVLELADFTIAVFG